jgi:hypothetical protein
VLCTAVPKREFDSVTPHRSDLLDPRPGYGVTQHIAWRQVEQAAVAERTIANIERKPAMILDRATAARPTASSVAQTSHVRPQYCDHDDGSTAEANFGAS